MQENWKEKKTLNIRTTMKPVLVGVLAMVIKGQEKMKGFEIRGRIKAFSKLAKKFRWVLETRKYWLLLTSTWTLLFRRSKIERKWKEGLVPRELKKSYRIEKLWNMKVTVIPVIIGALGTVNKWLVKALEDLEKTGRVETIQSLRR